MVIGLTGGICSGKTTVANFFKELGARIIDTDVIAREVVEPDTIAFKKIVKEWGDKGILNEDNTINRKKLAAIVFSSDEERKKLESIIHPEIAKKLIDILSKVKYDEVTIVIVPLLFEVGIQKLFDKIIVVYADEKRQLERLIRRDNLTVDEAKRRIVAQLPIEEKIKYADYIIDATKEINETKQEVIEIWHKLKEEKV